MNARTCLVPLAALPLIAAAPAPPEAAAPPAVRTVALCDDAYLGVFIGETEQGGATITDVIDNTPAATAGLRQGDRIVALGDRRVKGVDALLKLLRGHDAGDEVHVIFYREGDRRTAEVRLAGREQAPAGVFELPRGSIQVGLRVFEIEPDVAWEHPPAEDGGREALRHLLDRHAAGMDGWAEDFEERMESLHKRVQERWSDLARGLQRIEDQHGSGPQGAHLKERLSRLRAALRRDRAQRFGRIEEIRARLRDAHLHQRSELRGLREEREPRADESVASQPDDEVERLRDQVQALRKQVEDLKARLEEG